MRSPFAVFRKHQKLLTVVLTGLAMFAFVILGAVNDPSNMPPALIVIFVACMFGSVGWLLGIRSKKSSEFGFAGLVLGTLISVGAILAVGEPVRVKADSGNLNEREFDALRNQRALANQFLVHAVQLVQQRNKDQYIQSPALFGFSHPDDEKDLVLGELLRREANDLGIVVSDEMVNDYIRAVTQGKLGAADVRQIRSQMGISESDLYNILRAEIQAKFAAQFLYSQTVLPPESYWDFYQQLHVRQAVSIVPVPVHAFVDESSKPSESELAELFAQYREVFPNLGADGRLNEGQPGFRQPRKVRLAYVEAAYDPIESTIQPPTDEEVEAYYNEHFKPLPPEMLEPQSKTDEAADGETEAQTEAASQAPAADRSDAPAGDSTDPSTDAPAETDTPTGAAAPDGPRSQQPSDADEPSSSDESAAATPPADTPDANAPKADASDAEAEEGDAGALLPASSKTQLVALLVDDETTEATSQDAVTDTANESEPPAQQSAPSSPEDASTGEVAAGGAEAVEGPAAEAPPATEDAAETSDAPSISIVPDGPPPPPLAQPAGAAGSSEPLAVRELDDELRQEIREQILRERTEEKLQQVIEEASDFIRDLELKRVDAVDEALDQLPDDADAALQAQARQKVDRQILAELKAYAEKHGLTYVETPLMSLLELRRSEDYPIGEAVNRAASDPFNLRSASTVVDQLFQSEPREVFLSQEAVHPETESRFVYWKIEDQAEYTPASLSDPGIREQVANTWRELKAREMARARAAELVKMAEGKDVPLSEVFPEETITGEPDAAAITVLQPAPFSWMTASDPRLSSFPWGAQPPQRTQLPSVPGLIADSFMKTLFDDLSEGEVGIAHSIDKEYFYVVRVDERTFGSAENLEAFREGFMKEPLFAPYYSSHYPMLAQSKLQSYQGDWSEQLFKKHGVEILEPRHRRTAEGPVDPSAY